MLSDEHLMHTILNSMKNLVISGDSFCSDSVGWPGMLAQQLNLNLICNGFSGHHWWQIRKSLIEQVNADTDLIIICQTDTSRIPVSEYNTEYSLLPQTKKEQLANDYRVYIENAEYSEWAQLKWFEEIEQLWPHIKKCHLHCFPWTIKFKDSLKGMQVLPNLAAMSLNEINAQDFKLINDTRANHFSWNNNRVIGRQLAAMLQNYSEREERFDIAEFNLPTTKWFDWS